MLSHFNVKLAVCDGRLGRALPEIPPGLCARLTFDRTAAAWQHATAPSTDIAGQSQINVLMSRECLYLKVDTRRFDGAEARGKKVNR